MKHLIIYSIPNVGRTYKLVEMTLPQVGVSDPDTYSLPPDADIEVIIHNIQLECSFSIIQPLKVSHAQAH